MEKELKELQEVFALINMKAFCEKYNLQYDYLIKTLQGKFKLSEKKYTEYRNCLDLFFKEFSKN